MIALQYQQEHKRNRLDQLILKERYSPTVFLDRDGVINRNLDEHVLSWQDFHFEDGAIEALRLLHQAGYQVIVVTNQAVIERGLTSQSEIDWLHSQMVNEVQQAGGAIKAVLYCPHRPETSCFCRKPQPGMLLEAAERFKVHLAKSWFIGDYLTDIQAAEAAGCKPLLVLTGRGQVALEKWRQGTISTPRFHIKRNLLEATRYILREERVFYE